MIFVVLHTIYKFGSHRTMVYEKPLVSLSVEPKMPIPGPLATNWNSEALCDM